MRNTEWSFAMALTTTIGLAGCGGSEPTATVPASSATIGSEHAAVEPTRAPQPTRASAALQPLDGAAEPDMPPPRSPLDRVMRAHFKDALLIRQAVIAGTPEQAAEPAKILALIENLDDLPPGWRPFVERMQQAAKRVTDGSTTARTAAAAADLGVACGQCHLQQGGPTVKSEPPPPEGMTLEQRMKRHAWATERLWEGIVVPSGDAWDAGSKALVHTPFPDQVLRRGAAARTAATDFDKLVTQASSRKTMDERAALYAGLLLTCGTCHRAKPSGT